LNERAQLNLHDRNEVPFASSEHSLSLYTINPRETKALWGCLGSQFNR